MKTRGTCSKRRTLSSILCIVLTVAMALCMTGCNDKTPKAPPASGAAAEAGLTSVGEGSTVFSFTVVDKDGNTTPFEIHTDKENVGEALTELGLIDGEDSGYGLFVKTVNGITADYDTDGVYWAFYIDGEYAATGVDATPITDGADYSFRIE